MSRLLLSALAACALAIPAKAEIISLSYTHFQFFGNDYYDDGMRWRNISFGHPGHVCRFTMVFSDRSHKRNVIAQLLRLDFGIGGDPHAVSLGQPAHVATVASVGYSTVMQSKSVQVAERIDPTNAFYIAAIGGIPDPLFDGTIFDDDFASILGVQIDFRPEKRGCRTP